MEHQDIKEKRIIKEAIWRHKNKREN